MVVSLLLTIIGVMARGPPVGARDAERRAADRQHRHRLRRRLRVGRRIEDHADHREPDLRARRRGQLRLRSCDERSRINIEFWLDRDIDTAANDVRERVVARAGAAAAGSRSAADHARSTAAPTRSCGSTLSSDHTHAARAHRLRASATSSTGSPTVHGVAEVRINGERALRDAHLARPRGARGARQLTVAGRRERAARENVELPAGPHRIRAARVHAAHGHRPAHAGANSASWSSAAARTATWCGSARSRTCELAAEDERSDLALRRRAGARPRHHAAVDGQRARRRRRA